MVLTLPSRANKIFPYHVRTTQIGVMQITDVTDADTTFPFRHHQYAPSAPPPPSRPNPLVGEWVTDVPLELFTVSRHVAMSCESTMPKTLETTEPYIPPPPPPLPLPPPPPPSEEPHDSFLAPSQMAK
ncbi:hypothetical protein C0J52_07153 [Blattella germanica]|nr:hypothetical protein C0J52_07153 [Blattella germanica]